MGKDYYGILGVNPNAPECEIAKRFRMLAVTHHPEKNQNNMAQANFVYAQVCEAYEVLSNRKSSIIMNMPNCSPIAELRELYDKYGETLLKNGVPSEDGSFLGGYRFSGNTNEIFTKFFGTSNPFAVALDENGNQLSPLEQFQSMLNRQMVKKLTDLYVTVNCTLEELFYGCKKYIQFERIELQGD